MQQDSSVMASRMRDTISNSSEIQPIRDTRVLLVSASNNVHNTIIQHERLYSVFSKYGQVQRILIFKVTDPWTSFIEMDKVESAISAREALNGSRILDDGTRINVFASQKERIEFLEKNPAGVDYTILRQKIIEKQLLTDIENGMTNILSAEEEMFGDFKSQKNTTNSSNHSSTSNSSISDPSPSPIKVNTFSCGRTNTSQTYLNANSQTSSDTEERKSSDNNFKHTHHNNPSYFEDLDLAQSLYKPIAATTNQSMNSDHTNLSNSNNNNNNNNPSATNSTSNTHTTATHHKPNPYSQHHHSQQQQQQHYHHYNLATSAPVEIRKEPSSGLAHHSLSSSLNNANDDIYHSVDEKTTLGEFVHPQFAKITKKSPVLYISRIEGSRCSMTQLFNLFSAFGNIKRMIFMRAKSSLLVQYENIDHACLAKDYLQDTDFQGNILKIFFSHYDRVFFKEPADKPIDEEYFETTEKQHRFKAGATAHIHPPIDTLHVSNLRRESCSFDTLKKIFAPFGKINNYKVVLGENNKNMALVQFANESTAMLALANTHNTLVSNSCDTRISFKYISSEITKKRSLN